MKDDDITEPEYSYLPYNIHHNRMSAFDVSHLSQEATKGKIVSKAKTFRIVINLVALFVFAFMLYINSGFPNSTIFTVVLWGWAAFWIIFQIL